MPSFTKNAILDAFLQLVAKKPLEKVTVRDIVDYCGINRNTFYYHFQDIYAVFEEICNNGMEKADLSLPVGKMLATLFLTLTGFTDAHPKATANLSASLGRDGMERYCAPQLDHAIYVCLHREIPLASQENLRAASVFLRHAFIGFFADYVNQKGKTDADTLSEFLLRFTTGIVQTLTMENSDKNT